MHQPKVETFQVVSERNWLERLYYYHGFYCASHPGFVIFICGVLIFLCSAPIIKFFPFAATIPSEWNETVLNDVSTDEKPNWVLDKPVAYIQQVVVAILIEPVNTSLLIPHVVHEAFQPAFKIVEDIYEHEERNGTKSIKISDLCLLIHRDPFSGGRRLLPKKGCLLISPVNLWKDAASFQTDMDIMAKIYGEPSKNSVSLKENIFGVPLRVIGLFPLNAKKECLVIRYAITTVLRKHNPSYTKGLKNRLLNKYPSIVKVKSSSDSQTIVHIHYAGDNIVEIYHLCFTYFMVFIYLVFSVSKIDMVKSKLGLAFSAVVTVVASLSMAAGLCIFFGMVPTVSSSEIFPYLVIIVGLENILVITRSIVSTPAYLPVALRVAEGLSREGRSITVNLVTELLLLFCGYCTFVPAVQEFCMVGGVGVLTDFFLQIVFFATVLSIDLSRLEPQTQKGSPHVEIDVENSLSSVDLPHRATVKESPKKIGPEQSRTWSWKGLFAIRQDLPKRLNFLYFWARTRFVQRGGMVCAILYIAYATSSKLINEEQETLPDITQELSTDYDNLTSMSTTIPSSINTSRFKEEKHVLARPNIAERKPSHREKDSINRKSENCKDDMNSEGHWRDLSRHHWPELLDMYGVNVMDRYISVLPPINVQYKVNMFNFKNSISHVSESVSEFYQNFSKDSRWTSRSYAVMFELDDFVKVMYLFTGIFITTAIYLVYLMFTALPRRERRRQEVKDKVKAVVPVTSPIFLDGHEQNIECIDCDNNIIASSCLQGCVRVWHCKTSECISDIKRDRRSAQVWSLNCWDNCVAVGCSNGDVEIWDISSERLTFLYESTSCGVTSVLYVPVSKVLVLSRLDGALEFLELDNRFPRANDTSTNSKASSLSSSMKKKLHSNYSCLKTITNSLLQCDSYPCYSCRAHRKTINVLKACKDLIITASCDHLLKVFRSHTGLCLFTFRGHTSAVTALHIDEPDQGAISGSFDGELRLWSLISGDCKRFSPVHSCSIIAIVCTGICIVSLDVSELLCIWDQPTRNCLHRLSQFPGGCHNFTLMSTNLAVCVGRGTIVVLDLTTGQILRIVELEQKNDHILMNHVMKPCPDTVVCDYGERLVLLTFLEIIDKLE